MDHITKINDELYMTTTKAPVNIAVIKYWGKTNEDLIIPANESLSLTLSTEHLCATTTVAVGKKFREDRIWLNGKEELIRSPRLQSCLHEMQSLGTLFHIEGDLSGIARRGSGSACRSMYGGFVAWVKGSKPDGSDSVAKQIASSDHWPQMRVIILVASDAKKDTSSSHGMARTMETSALIQERASNIVPQRMKDMADAILEQDFNKFAEITMKESNQLHAVCLDSYPPIHYMTSASWDVVSLVHRYNRFYGTNKLAYSFDAGPNACLFLLEESLPEVLALIEYAFPTSTKEVDFFRGRPAVIGKMSQELVEYMAINPQRDAVKFAIITHPAVPGLQDCLISEALCHRGQLSTLPIGGAVFSKISLIRPLCI
ncbi:diphosphomevalonate decarboxylase isoform X7 [Dermacentor andersoni]|uniref:diphosphomevalonate decarboxylase isoform X7 n=1 Tax=Dermacentor andersoni TaxID=34620 RepID=UPI002417A331|nr:diphosphomevalonate decarboxylase-like isoform X8 [Dermacentor andersoni]